MHSNTHAHTCAHSIGFWFGAVWLVTIGQQDLQIVTCEGGRPWFYEVQHLVRTPGGGGHSTPSGASHSQYLNIIHKFMKLDGNAHLPVGSKDLFFLELSFM